MNKLPDSPLNSDQIKQEIAECVQQIATSPQPAEVHAHLGKLYVFQQQWQEAKACYEQAVKINPELAAAYLNLAQIWEKLGNQKKVAHNLFLALKLRPHAAPAEQHYELGKTLQSQNKPGKAIASYHRAINIKPDFLAAYQSLKALLIQQGKNQRALAICRQGVAQNPQNPQFHLALGQALTTAEKWLQAIDSYQTALKLDPNLPEAYCYLGQALIQIKKYAQAQECYQQAIALQTDYWEAYYQLGLMWQDQEQWEQAIAVYKVFRAIKPKFAITLLNMGLIYRYLEQYDSAIAAYREAISIITDLSEETTAFTGYQQTLAENPQKSADLYYQLGKLLRAKGRFPEAIAAYKNSIKLDSNFKHAYIDLQYTPIASEQLTKLSEFYRQIVIEHPNITIAWGNLGDALTQQDRVTEAIDCYRTGCYQEAIHAYPYLAKLDWKEQKECGPDFIIAGASKSGTSSIHYYLSRHPQILLSHKKEIDFYRKNFQRGIEWYLAHFPTLTDREDFLTGEATPNYLRFPEVAQRIKDTFPQVKIIILLRNPADRAISWHYHKLNTGLTNQDLASAIAEEIERLASVSETEIINTGYYNPDNILSSLYIYKLKPWIELLGREQFLILKSEEFYSNPHRIMAKVFKFLGLPNCPLENYPQVNAGSYNQVDSDLRETLVNYFAPYNQQLEEYLDIKFDWN
ncbi:tetratricopeptide repeat protein [Pleurocapsa sp. PCC 7319]|uniref:tetratricopeptide repeat protein n=1 Tax=Pleurocapsa sp. PCC 7319 TaxID=118161 RepID=UPI00034565C0|nr:tetratricopeptide repeat protein [Pleurocapsa sp. PCC 7319]